MMRSLPDCEDPLFLSRVSGGFQRVAVFEGRKRFDALNSTHEVLRSILSGCIRIDLSFSPFFGPVHC
jgi:hypothetical protein